MSGLTPGREAALRDHGPIPTDVWGEIDAIRRELARVSAQRDEYWKLDADIGALRAELAELQRDNLEIDAETEKLRVELAEAHMLAQAACLDTGVALTKLAEANARVAELVRACDAIRRCRPGCLHCVAEADAAITKAEAAKEPRT